MNGEPAREGRRDETPQEPIAMARRSAGATDQEEGRGRTGRGRLSRVPRGAYRLRPSSLLTRTIWMNTAAMPTKAPATVSQGRVPSHSSRK